jgi:hypothetical protein
VVGDGGHFFSYGKLYIRVSAATFWKKSLVKLLHVQQKGQAFFVQFFKAEKNSGIKWIASLCLLPLLTLVMCFDWGQQVA